MDNLKFTQVSAAEFKLECPTEFCLNRLGNDLVLYGNSTEFYTLEMLHTFDFLNNLPYQINLVKVPQEKPLTNLVKHVDFVEIYKNDNVLETQELALDHIYIAECSTEPPKPRLLQVEYVPRNNDSKLCCVLSSYGACELLIQDTVSMEWTPYNTQLSRILITAKVFPLKKTPSNIKTFRHLKSFVDTYHITAYAWSSGELLYLATAAGCLVALKYLQNDNEFEVLSTIETSLGRISYIKSMNNLLVVGCNLGQVRLLKFNNKENNFKEMDYLWNRKDRMACRKAIMTYSASLQSYFVIFCKASHILAYRLDSEGSIMSNSTLYVSGIKISGLEILSDNEFIATTIRTTIHHITITCPSQEELKINVQSVEHDLDVTNLLTYGVAASKSRNLWCFLLSRNKEYTHQSKYSSSTTFVYVCKLNTHDSLSKLKTLNLACMDVAHDLVIAVNIDINNNGDGEKYNEYLDVLQWNRATDINYALTQRLQIKLMIVRKTARYQQMKFKVIKRQIVLETSFLEIIVQIFHILQRIEYLQTRCSHDVKLSPFQTYSVVCMQTKYLRLLNILMNSESEENPLATATECFLNFATEKFEKYKFDVESLKIPTEICSICDGAINIEKFDQCENGHDIRRCTISYVQLPLFLNKYCPHCSAPAINDDEADLSELFGPNELVKCTFCRYLLKTDSF